MTKPEQMTAHQQQVLEELTAYLDGELDAEESRRVEERLARDPEYCTQLQRLQRAWDLLDRLPRVTVGDAFTKTTVEMVAIAAAAEAQDSAAENPRHRRRRWFVALCGGLAAGLAGFFVGGRLWPDPNEQLLRDLPVIEDLDLYNQADYIDLNFLHMLDQHNLFQEDTDRAG